MKKHPKLMLSATADVPPTICFERNISVTETRPDIQTRKTAFASHRSRCWRAVSLAIFFALCVPSSQRAHAEVKVWVELWPINKPKEDVLAESSYKVYVFADNQTEARSTKGIEWSIRIPEGTGISGGEGVKPPQPRPWFDRAKYFTSDFFSGHTMSATNSTAFRSSSRRFVSDEDGGFHTNVGLIGIYFLREDQSQIGRQKRILLEGVKAWDQDMEPQKVTILARSEVEFDGFFRVVYGGGIISYLDEDGVLHQTVSQSTLFSSVDSRNNVNVHMWNATTDGDYENNIVVERSWSPVFLPGATEAIYIKPAYQNVSSFSFAAYSLAPESATTGANSRTAHIGAAGFYRAKRIPTEALNPQERALLLQPDKLITNREPARDFVIRSPAN